MELQLLLILAVAFLVLGPEKTMELATKMGELIRKVRETWDELRYQMYIENLNKKITEETKESDSAEEYTKEEVKKDEHGETSTTYDAPDRPSERTQKQAD